MRKNGPEGLASQCAKMGLWRSWLPHSLGPRSAVLLRTGGGRHPIEKSRSYHLTIFVITIKFNQFSFPYSYHRLYSFCHLSSFVSSKFSVNSLIYLAKEIELKDIHKLVCEGTLLSGTKTTAAAYLHKCYFFVAPLRPLPDLAGHVVCHTRK